MIFAEMSPATGAKQAFTIMPKRQFARIVSTSVTVSQRQMPQFRTRFLMLLRRWIFFSKYKSCG